MKLMAYTQKQFADMFGFSKSAVNKWVHEGKIPTIEFIDGVKRIPASFVDEKVGVSEGKLVVADDKEEYRKWFRKLDSEEQIKEIARLTIP